MILVINGGGTTFKLGVFSQGKLIFTHEIPTEIPEKFMPKLIDFLQEQIKKYPIRGIGIAIFGPLEIRPNMANYGSITTTDKKGWANFPIYKYLKNVFPNLPIGIHNDLCAAGMAEYRANQKKHPEETNLLYFSIATGVGASFIKNGYPVYGENPPELGHISIQKHPNDEKFAGVCTYHGDCLEGLASGPAVEKRAGVASAKQLPTNHPVWEIEIDYIAQALANYAMIYAPKRIVLTGGLLLGHPWLVDKINQAMIKKLNNYCKAPILSTPILGRNAELFGAAILGNAACTSKPKLSLSIFKAKISHFHNGEVKPTLKKPLITSRL